MSRDLNHAKDREFQCPECRAMQPEPGRCGRCPGITLPVGLIATDALGVVVDVAEHDPRAPDHAKDRAMGRGGVSTPDKSRAVTFLCPGCGEEEFPDEVGVVTCECGAHVETLEPLGLRRILPNFWTRLRGSAAPAIPPRAEADRAD